MRATSADARRSDADDRHRRQASRDRAHQGPQERPRRARRHLPLRRARASTRSSPTTWRCSAGTASTPSAPRSRPRRGDAGPVRGDRRPVHAADQVPERRSSAPSSCGRSAGWRSATAAGWATSPPARTSSCTTCAIEDMPVVLDELNAVGLSFTQACGDVWRNVVGCPLAGVDGHELIDSRPADRRPRADVRRRPRVLEPAPQVQGVGVGAACTAAPSTRSTTSAWWPSSKDGVIGYDVWVGGGLGASARMGRRLDVFVLPERGGRGVPRDHRDLPRRGQAHQAHPGAHQVPGRRVGRRAAARRGRAQASAASCRRSVEPADADRPAPRPPGRAPAGRSPGSTTWAATTLRGRFTADQMIGVADIADRYGSGELRCTNRQNIIVVDVPDAHVDDGGRRARRPGPADRGVGVPARRHLVHRHGVLQARDRRDQAARAAELIEHLERRIGDLDGSIRINLNGCPNACAQYQIADIGLQGGIATTADGRAGAGLHPAHRRPAGRGRGLRPAGRRPRRSRPTTPATPSSGSCAPTRASGGRT